jgi:hypothetical protein
MTEPKHECRKDCEDKGKHVYVHFVSLICVAQPQDFVLVQCPACKSVDVIPTVIWFKDALVCEKKTESK